MKNWIKRKKVERRAAIWYARLMAPYLDFTKFLPCDGTYKQLLRKAKLLRLQVAIDLKRLSGRKTKLKHYWQRILFEKS